MAQTSEDVGAAKVLFDEALNLRRQGKLAEACERFAASVKAAPRAASLLNLGDCQEKLGRSATAWNTFTRAATQARLEGRAQAEAEARRRADVLWPRLARLRIQLAPGARVDGLEVRRDDEVLRDALLGRETPVDPGEHEVIARAPGMRTWSTRVTIEEGDAREVVLPALEPDTTESEPVPSTSSEPASGAGTTTGAAGMTAEPRLDVEVEAKPRPAGRTRRITGLAIGGAGIVALGVGAFFGLRAFSSWGDVEDGCDLVGGTYECDSVGRDARDDAATAATISNIAFGVGIGAVAAGAFLYFTAPRAGRNQPRVGVAPAAGGGLLTWTGGF